MDLPIDNPDASFDDYADTVVEALADQKELVLVGHSRAGNVLPRAANRLAAHKLIYLCASFEPATIGRLLESEKTKMPQRNSDDFWRAVIGIGGEMTVFDRELAKQLLYSDCSPEIQEWAANRLRPQRRSDNEPVLKAWPQIAQEYIVCKNDLVVHPEWSKYVAKNWLGIDPIEFPSGHSPFLARPQQLAQLLISLI